ncbi:MAG: ribosome-associated translation inhibitor RaiA [Erysipelotrichales bacterium]|nr:ribosome-associated translation inhibitor RaiA [Bacilli bacterium]MEA4822348.1 ribosome-associated translation inhibitor RaiA [Erysipelotrichales bacterium]
MKYQIVGKNVSITPAIEGKILKKLSVLDKFLIVKDSECRVVITIVPDGQKIEVTIQTKYAILRGEVVDRDLYAAIDLVVDKLGDQIRRAKTKLDRRHRENLGKAFVLSEIEDIEMEEIPVKTKEITVDTMDLDTAIANMELLGHSFFIYKDDEEEKIAVVYKRKNGGYGLIEVE